MHRRQTSSPVTSIPASPVRCLLARLSHKRLPPQEAETVNNRSSQRRKRARMPVWKSGALAPRPSCFMLCHSERRRSSYCDDLHSREPALSAPSVKREEVEWESAFRPLVPPPHSHHEHGREGHGFSRAEREEKNNQTRGRQAEQSR